MSNDDYDEKIPMPSKTKVSKLETDGDNPNEMTDEEFEALKDNISRYGFTTPVITDNDYIIADGEHRAKAAEDLGMDKLPVIALDVDRVDRKILRQVHNKLRGEHDEDRDKEELDEILDAGRKDDLDVLLGGDDDIDELLTDLREPSQDEIEEARLNDEEDIDVEVERRDVWELGQHRLMCGDATNKEHVETLIHGEEAAITFTSPPYNAGKSEELSGNTNMNDNKYTEYDDDKKQSEWRKLVQNTLNLAMKHSQHQFYNIQQLAGNKTALIELLYDNKQHFTDTIIWDKQNAAPVLPENVLNSRFEYIHIFSEEENAKRTIKTANFRGNVDNVYTGKPQSDNEYSEVHAATFPIDLPTWIIKNFTQRNDAVIDNFAGTGTTLLAAEQTNRKAYCMELDPQYCQVTINRWEELTGKTANKHT